MPKISKQGPSWETDEPRVPLQRDDEQVPADEVEQANDEAVTEYLASNDYEDKDAWPYAKLQQESRDRWSEAPVNGVSREELIERLRADDEAKK